MLLIKRLDENELTQLLKEAPDNETRNLFRILKELHYLPYEFFDKFAIDQFGLIIDDRPIYFVALTQDEDGRKDLWTVANSNIEKQFTFYREIKKKVKEWSEKYKEIYATMERNNNDKNINWTSRLGFKVASENQDTITFCLKGGN